MNRKKQLRQIIDQTSFALDDCRLFLDTHPHCREALEYYEKMENIRHQAIKEYTAQFGPILAYDVTPANEWIWNQGPMPWEREGC